MTVAAGALPAPSNTARPAEKGAAGRMVDPALERRTVTAIVTLSATVGVPLRRSEARAVVRSRLAMGETPDEIEAYLRTTFRMDPTGVTAARNVDRERGHR